MNESTRGTGRRDMLQLTAGAAITAAEIWQLRDGRCARKEGGGASSGALVSFNAADPWVVPKTAGIVILDGGRVYWDWSANAATYCKVNDRDFYMGRSVGDAASANTSLTVNFNIPEFSIYDYDIARVPFATSIIGTQALGGLALNGRGASQNFKLDATNEAQKIDILSRDGFATGACPIIEAMFRVIADDSGIAAKFSFGIASGTHATAVTSITSRLMFQLSAHDGNIYALAGDGTHTVAPTDTTVDYAVGTRHEAWLDCRDSSNVKLYIDGVRVLSGTTFNISSSATTWYLLAHLVKTAATDTAEIDVERLLARLAQQ